MTISAASVGAAVTPTVIKTYIAHYADRSSRRRKPTAHISYDEGLHLIRSFLEYASHHTVEDLQAFTSQWVPNPSWVRTENATIPQEYITKAADRLITQLGEDGIKEVGGVQWWQWRRKNAELKAEWIEMRADFNARKQLGEKSKRIMLYIHGGAYFFGSVDEHRYQIQRHARKLKARVIATRYRLAPQFPFPCGLHDCLSTYLYLLSIHDKTEIILAGDSAGGGMVVSILCLLRDQGLPLPAGAVLISPWVDLTHSFPSVAANNTFDYIPPYGFMQKPSVSWPPPNDVEMDAIRSGAGHDLVKDRNKLEKGEVNTEATQGFSITDVGAESTGNDTADRGATTAEDQSRTKSTAPGPSRHLQIEISGKMVELKDQIQMYATNQLISHPLVSPVLQPSLGGLPPLLIMTGGGEMLRDEQIYLAHKAAHPAQYPLGDEYAARYDPKGQLLTKYKPTPVQLQVWEDLCHVAPTLSFTRPAKFMYRSIAQFGAWALARAQNTTIEIVDDDAISIISTDSDASRRRNDRASKGEGIIGSVGKAGDPLPPFKHHMIRQHVDRHGDIYPLEDADKLPALQMHANDVGTIKYGPVKKWMDAKFEWDTKYARIKRKVQKQRIADLIKGGTHSFEGEEPPPSALAGRRKDQDIALEKPKKSYWMAIWSGWGSKHDEDTIKREEEVFSSDGKLEQIDQVDGSTTDETRKNHRLSLSGGKSKSKSRSRSRNRRRTTIVSNAGQVEGDGQDGGVHGNAIASEHTSLNEPQEAVEKADNNPAEDDSTNDTHLTPMFIPKFKTAAHLRNDSKDTSDASSIITSNSVMSPDNASTRAVFSAAGVSKDKAPAGRETTTDTTTKLDYPLKTADTGTESYNRLRNEDARSALGGYDTPHSRRSVERLMSHQVDMDGVSLVGTESSAGPSILLAPKSGPFRSPSTMAIVQHEGTVDVVEGGVADPHADLEEESTPTQEKGQPTSTLGVTKIVEAGEVKIERPGMYNRGDSEFKTAMEHL